MVGKTEYLTGDNCGAGNASRGAGLKVARSERFEAKALGLAPNEDGSHKARDMGSRNGWQDTNSIEIPEIMSM